jgi:hypothetical protein
MIVSQANVSELAIETLLSLELEMWTLFNWTTNIYKSTVFEKYLQQSKVSNDFLISKLF